MEHLAISGRVQINEDKKSLLTVVLEMISEFEIQQGYLNHRTLVGDENNSVELEIFADCVIKNSNALKCFIERLNELISFESSIKVDQDRLNDPWATVVVLKNRVYTTTEFKTYLPNDIILAS